ncbi:ZIP family metal transporter [Halomonas garicola]|uniref:ZIP family metal transporter n=1 Tax=Halomonas garicola TaxID=1690008 RepID=UPI002897584B|nr:divalent cation transporter [Halomonas garicola]
MPETLLVLLLALGAGVAMPAGAVFARFDRLHPAWLGSEWRHFIVAFGGGALISAIALVLVPDGVAKLPPLAAGLSFAAGGVTFFLLDILLNRLQSAAGQMVAMLSDFIPEAIALGAAFAAGENTGLLLAFLIALQNLPEGFNAFEELARSGRLAQSTILSAFFAMALLGPASALAGYYWLGQYPLVMGTLLLFASGGILYLVFDDIAPQAKLKNTWMPALGAVAGFLLGLSGSMLAG